jgi:hypothetical protein
MTSDRTQFAHSIGGTLCPNSAGQG